MTQEAILFTSGRGTLCPYFFWPPASALMLLFNPQYPTVSPFFLLRYFWTVVGILIFFDLSLAIFSPFAPKRFLFYIFPPFAFPRNEAYNHDAIKSALICVPHFHFSLFHRKAALKSWPHSSLLTAMHLYCRNAHDFPSWWVWLIFFPAASECNDSWFFEFAQQLLEFSVFLFNVFLSNSSLLWLSSSRVNLITTALHLKASAHVGTFSPSIFCILSCFGSKRIREWWNRCLATT